MVSLVGLGEAVVSLVGLGEAVGIRVGMLLGVCQRCLFLSVIWPEPSIHTYLGVHLQLYHFCPIF